jgi:hypothetical protein
MEEFMKAWRECVEILGYEDEAQKKVAMWDLGSQRSTREKRRNPGFLLTFGSNVLTPGKTGG